MLLAAVRAGSELQAYAHLPPDGGHVVIGRHPRCDLRVGADPSVGLRHAVVAVRCRGDALGVQVWTLGAVDGVWTEDGRHFATLVSEGSSCFAIGRVHVFALVTGPSALPWSTDGATTWADLRARVVVNGVRFPVGRAPSFDLDDPTALVDDVRTGLRVRATRGSGEVIGVLRIGNGLGQAHVPVTDHGLERGVMLGRADRCDVGGRFATLSRLHALLVRRDGAPWILDTASRNGLLLGATPVRQARLDHGTTVQLGGPIAIAWHARAEPGRPRSRRAPRARWRA